MPFSFLDGNVQEFVVLKIRCGIFQICDNFRTFIFLFSLNVKCFDPLIDAFTFGEARNLFVF